MKYFLGVDIGATKSHALLVDETGQAVGFGSGGPGNHEVVDYPGLIAVLGDICEAALAMAGRSKADLAGAGFGVAGYDWPSERQLTLDAISTLGLTCPVEAVNDTVIGLIAGASQGWGVAVVGGTGDNCWGWDRQRRTAHVSGDGIRMAEWGGASSVVFRAVQHISRSWSWRGPQTQLTEAFCQRTGAATVDNLLEGLVLEHFYLSAADAPLVVQVAEAGDALARECLSWAAEGLADMAGGVIRQLHLEEEELEVVQTGSMFKAGLLYVEPFHAAVRQVAPRARFVSLQAPPVVGGVLLGMQMAGLDGNPLRQRLAESTRRLL
jgi:N-acetylglucosamine kinase-like BadF-type ATPase